MALRILILFLFLASALAYGQQDQSTRAADAAAIDATKTQHDAGFQLDLQPDANGALSQEQMQRLFRVVADKDMENDKRLRDYTYVERDEEHRLDNKGQVKSTEVKTYDVMELYGEQVQRLIEKDVSEPEERKRNDAQEDDQPKVDPPAGFGRLHDGCMRGHI